MPRHKTTDPHKYYVEGQGWRVKIAGRAYRLGPDEGPAETKRRRLVSLWLAAGGPDAEHVDLDRLEHGPPEHMTIAAALAEYQERGIADGLDERQVRRIDRALDAVVAMYGRQPIANFGALELKRVREHFLRSGGSVYRFERKKRGETHKGTRRQQRHCELSRKYVNSLVGCIKSAWTWLASERLAPATRVAEMRCVRGLQYGQGGRELPATLPADLDHVAKAITKMSKPVAAMVRIQALTGMRPGEVCAMRRADLSTSPAEVLYPPNAPPIAAMDVGGTLVWVYAPSVHKTRARGKARLVALGPIAQAILKPFLAKDRDPEEFLFRPVDAVGDRLLPNGGRPGKRYTASTFYLAVRRACIRAGVPIWRPGRLRHNVATDLFPEDPATAAAVLGHSQPSMSHYYAAQTLKKAAAQAAKSG